MFDSENQVYVCYAVISDVVSRTYYTQNSYFLKNNGEK